MGFFDKFKKNTDKNTEITENVINKTTENVSDNLEILDKSKANLQEKDNFNKFEEGKQATLGLRDVVTSENAKIIKKNKAVSYVQGVVDNLGINPELTVSDISDGILIEFHDEAIIGQTGEVLDALQYLTSAIINRREPNFFRISMECGNYRKNRAEELSSLAEKFSKTVIRTGHSSAMMPMNAFERRVIHSKISEIKGVHSKSVGDEPFRKVVIYPENPKPQRAFHNSRGQDTKNSTNYRKNPSEKSPEKTPEKSKVTPKKREPYVPHIAKPLDLRTSFEKEYKRK
jgi:spoIIIJ-associated protein